MARPVSAPCDEYELNRDLFQRFPTSCFEAGHVVLERRGSDSVAKKADKEIVRLGRMLQEKSLVAAEWMAE